MKEIGKIPVILFDDKIPEYITSNDKKSISLSSKYTKFSERSLKWDIKNNETLVIDKTIGYKEFDGNDHNQKRDSFVIWIYNEKKVEDKLTLEFCTGENCDCYFDFNLNYEGFRGCFVMFERDMEGTPQETMDRLIIKAPTKVSSHTLYIDKIILSVPYDARHHSRDYQVPFVNIEADKKANSHWMSLYTFSKAEKQTNLLGEYNEKDLNDLEIIEGRYREYIFKNQEITDKTIDNIKENYKGYNIRYEDNVLKGRPVNFLRYFELFDFFDTKFYSDMFNGIALKEYVGFMYEVASVYNSSKNTIDKNILKEIFINLSKHLYNQGFGEGSGLGTVHHLGYAFRDYYKAKFLMKDVLKEEGLLDRTGKSMAWFCGMGRMFYENLEAEGSNMDTLNTLLQPILTSILLIDDKNKKVAFMNQFSKWISYSTSAKDGLKGPFKADGSGFHHGNLYPAYTVDGLEGLTPVVYFLSKTNFRLNEEQHRLIKKVVLNLRLYCNKYEWLVSLGARHPNGSGLHTILRLLPFKYLALAGSPDEKEAIDIEMASAYLRLEEDKNDPCVIDFIEKGIRQEEEPNGNWALNYGALAIHRRDNYLVGVRGHNRYLWANESYQKANLYGRYISHGNIQIMGCGDPVSNNKSGYVKEGWDFNSWPGTTTIHLPVDELKSDVKNVDAFSGYEEMLISDETFAGGLSLENQNGMFAMKLHEHPKYNGSHRARKSVFFFDNRIVCLGTNIENINEDYETRTTLFQNHLETLDEEMYVNGDEKIVGLNYMEEINSDKPIRIIDNKGNGYYIGSDQKVTVMRGLQYSKDHNTCENTQGNFAKAYISHGKAPKEGKYEYMIIVKSNLDQMKALEIKKKNKDTKVYTVLQNDYDAHIVKDIETSTTGHALFQVNTNINNGIIKSNDTPCMVMTKESKDKLIMSVCDPDLRLYEGKDESQYDEKGNRKEVSIYSRKWKNNPSKQHTVKLKLKGNWEIQDSRNNCRVLERKDNITKISFDCIEALGVECILKNIKGVL